MLPADYEGQSTECGPQHTQVGKAKVDRPPCGVFEKNIRAAIGVVGQSLRLYETLRPMRSSPKAGRNFQDQDYKRGINNDFVTAPSAPRSWDGAHGSFEDVCCDNDGFASQTIEMSA